MLSLEKYLGTIIQKTPAILLLLISNFLRNKEYDNFRRGWMLPKSDINPQPLPHCTVQVFASPPHFTNSEPTVLIFE